MPTQAQLNEWHKAFARIERVEDYQRIKKHFAIICEQIEQLEEDIEHFKSPRNPREDIGQRHDKIRLRALQRQKPRWEEKLKQLAKQIEIDIETSKQE
jgi:chaperonin cofactor prefoldin